MAFKNGEMFSGPEGRRRKYRWLSLALLFLFLACGGSIAWFMMKNAAHRLAGADNPRPASGSSLYGKSAGISEADSFFASEEELAKADTGLRNELLGLPDEQKSGVGSRELGVGGQGTGVGGQGSGTDGNADRVSEKDFRTASAAGSAMRQRLAARGTMSQAPGGGQTSQSTAFGPGGDKNAAKVRSSGSAGRTASAGAGIARKASIMDSLRSAFKATLYGARIASKDAARNWTAKAFDGATDAGYSIEYDEKMKAELDRINPDSIPRFLKEQSLDADAARSLQMSDVGEPVDDPAGAREALNKDFAQAMFPMFGMFGGSGGGGANDPVKDPGLGDLGLQEYMDPHGYGAECGCTQAAPCCCLPANYYTGNGPIGDFPSPGGTLPG